MSLLNCALFMNEIKINYSSIVFEKKKNINQLRRLVHKNRIYTISFSPYHHKLYIIFYGNEWFKRSVTINIL